MYIFESFFFLRFIVILYDRKGKEILFMYLNICAHDLCYYIGQQIKIIYLSM